MRRTKKQIAVCIVAVLLFGCERSAEKPVLNVYNWANYIGNKTIAQFEDEFGVRVNYDNFSNNEELLAKLQAGGKGYDVIFPSDYMVRIMVGQGLLSPLNESRISNLKNVQEIFRDAEYEKPVRHCAPYFWGTAGIAVNTKYVKEPVKSWKILWDEKYKGRISMLDDPRAGILPALLLSGSGINESDPRAINRARDLMIEQKPLVRTYTSDTYPDLLRSEEVWLAQGYTGDVYQVAADKPEIKYVIPDEGTEIAIDNMCIPASAPHKDLAHEFINFLLRADVGAAIANDIKYPSTNGAARAQIDPRLLEDDGIYPSREVSEKLFFQKDLGEHAELYDRAWSELKAR